MKESMTNTNQAARKVDMTDFISRLGNLRTSRVTFRLPFSEADAEAMLHEAVRQEVKYWGREYIADNRAAVAKAAHWLSEMPTPGLIIFGNVGNGKTTLLNAITNLINAYSLGCDTAGKQAWMKFIGAESLARYAKGDEEKMWAYIRTPMLALDDLGAEQDAVKTYGNIVNPAVELLSYRYQYRLFTIATTNLKAEEMRQRYGDRVADRMNEMFTRIIIKNDTYRTRK